MPAKVQLKAERAVEQTSRVFNLWLFGGDVTYALLPLLVMAVIHGLLPGRIEHFVLLKEWSFATIIFFGVSIRKLVHLKIRIQQTPRSIRLETGLQFQIVFLVIAVLVLACVVLLELKVFPMTAAPILGVAQISLFSFGLVATLISVAAENEVFIFDGIAMGRPRAWFFHRIKGQLDAASDRLDAAMYLIEHAKSARTLTALDLAAERRAYQRRAADATDAVNRLATLIDELQEEYQALLQLHKPNITIPSPTPESES